MNNQATQAGKQADDIINNLANPGAVIETDKATVEVLDKAQPVEDWKKRFTGLKSSQDKTIHSLRQKVSQFDLMESENQTLKKRLEETQAQIPATPNEMLELFSEEEVKGFKKMMQGEVGGLQSEVERLTEELEYTRQERIKNVAMSEHQTVVEAVSNAIPHYTEIDVDPGFAEYMKDVDEFGNIRYDLLVKAKNETPPDIGRIVSFYSEYSEIKQNDEAKPPQYTQQELLQQPKSSEVGITQAPHDLGINWNQAMISQFYKDKATGKISSADAVKLEQDLYRAVGKR